MMKNTCIWLKPVKNSILVQLYAIIICWLNNVRDKEVTFGQEKQLGIGNLNHVDQ